MPGSHSKKDKLKKKVRKAGLGKKDYEEERKEYEKSIHRKPHKRDLKHSPPVRESNPRTPLKKEVPFGIKNDLGKESKDTTEKMRQMIRHNVKGKKIRPPKPTQKQRARIIEARLSKIRKADQQDINRVKRWNSRSFNKKRELSGTTEPVFKTTATIKLLTGRPQPGIRGDELTAKLRKRVAKIRSAYKQTTWGNKNFLRGREKETIYTKDTRSSIGGFRKNRVEGVASSPISKKPKPAESQSNDPVATRKRKMSEYFKKRGLTGKVRKRIARVKKEKTNFGVTLKEKDKFLRRREEPVRDSHPKTPLLKEVPFGPKSSGRDYVGTYGKDLQEELKQRARHEVTNPPIKIRPKKPTQKQRARIIKARLAKIRKADGGIAPNYNNPSQVHKPSKIRKKKSKTAAKSKTGYLGDASVAVPWDTGDLGGLTEANISFRDMAQFHRRRMWVEKQGTFPQIWNLGKLTAEGQDASRIFDAAHDAEKRFLEDMGPEKYQKNMEQQIEHLNKEYGPDPDDDPDSIISISEAYSVDVPEDVSEASEQLKKKERMARQRKALRSHPGRHRKVNPIKPTKAYKKPPQGPNPDAQTPEAIRKNAEIVGRDNASYIGKRIARIRKAGDFKNQGDPETDVDFGYDSKERFPNILNKKRKKKSKIRKAGEQIDPRVKKRKTVRPDSPVQKVSQIKDRIAEMKTAKDHSHSIVFRKHEGMYYRRASLQKQEGKYAKYWLLNAKQTNGNGWGVSRTSIAKNIHKFIGRPFVITAKQWIPESEYGEQFEHPYLPTNNIENIISHQEKFRVGSIVDVIEKDGDYHAVIEINSKFANMMLPPFCSPAIFQNNPGEADGDISDWEALHLAGLMEDPAYGARIALLKGSCMGTAEACSIQFRAAKQTTMCPKKKAKLVRRIDRLGD